MKSKWWWDIANATKEGQYLKEKESRFLNMSLKLSLKPELNTETSRILDAGAGSGMMSIPLSERFDVVALDLDIVPLLTYRKNKNNIPLIHADGLHLPFKDESFDFVIANQVLDEFGSKCELFLSEASRVLKDGGALVTNFSNKRSYKRVLHLALAKLKGSPYIYYRGTFFEMQRLLINHGFRVEKAWGYNWLPFARASDNLLIHIFQRMEEVLKLENIPRFSPWVFVCAKKEVLKHGFCWYYKT